ncbi:hypothetical protein Agabi119p4_5689 [Agaricus bisporus var. burnettii]|uniref:Uncharacterized protein n=1 Tax=Agaricus bisporus var. burnettii TaxID=192524 RepID=A0A8H7C5V2_AGABI|nr:hypothetical protein Agabi119p4_9109 [Agaricus bisporus var. burnettii]KAF7773522.1 hypothetical protein Agabi119p4_5689 [Agaricus bisporus var. burnettii]
MSSTKASSTKSSTNPSWPSAPNSQMSYGHLTDYDNFSGATLPYQSQHRLIAWEEARQRRRAEAMMDKDEQDRLLASQDNPAGAEISPQTKDEDEVEIKEEESVEGNEAADKELAEDTEDYEEPVGDEKVADDVKASGQAKIVTTKRKRAISISSIEGVEEGDNDVPSQKKQKKSPTTAVEVQTGSFSIKVVVSWNDGSAA